MSAMPNQPSVGPSKDSVAAALAAAHRDVDPAITLIFRIEKPGQEADPKEPVKLLEVNPNTSISGILPVGFSAHPASGIHFPSVIVEVHPREFESLQSGALILPHGWRVIFDKPLGEN